MDGEKVKSEIPPVIIVGVIFFFMLRPQEGYLQMLDFLIFLIENGLLLENIFIFEVFSLLVLFPIFILLYIFRNPIGRAINRRMHLLIAKDVIEEFDKDGDNTLSKEESQRFFTSIMDDEQDVFISKKDSDALFDKHDSNKDGKLDSDEVTSLILELFHDLRTKEGTQTSLSEDDPVQEEASEDETQKLDRLYNEGYLSEERYERLKQDLSR
jgi:hypothetical protein